MFCSRRASIIKILFPDNLILNTFLKSCFAGKIEHVTLHFQYAYLIQLHYYVQDNSWIFYNVSLIYLQRYFRFVHKNFNEGNTDPRLNKRKGLAQYGNVTAHCSFFYSARHIFSSKNIVCQSFFTVLLN